MKKIALFPGSFDPITKGHEDLIHRSLPLFDHIIIGIGKNANKQYMFSLEDRMAFIKDTFKEEPKVSVEAYEGLTTKFAIEKNAQFLLRGIRNGADFEFEKAIAQANKKLFPELETLFLNTAPEYSFLSSSIVRDIIRNGGDYQQFVPKGVRSAL